MQLSIEDVISPYVQLKKEGRHKKALCPFHLEKTPSFVVYEDTQSFYCFGCGAGGDSITFIMKMENLDYMDAVEFLAKRSGLEMPSRSEDDQSVRIKARILEINKEAARFFHKCLISEENYLSRSYFIKRGLTLKTIKTYGLGYAPDKWNQMKDYLLLKNYTIDEMLQADLLARSKKGIYYPTFKNRVMFPIIDLRGNVIAFGGRVLDDSKPKYRNSADTPAFKKSRTLFSLNFAKNTCAQQLILAEGYMDVIAIYQAGFTNVAATLGTALTAEQARLISRYTKEVIIAYDMDEAGQIATKKAAKLLGEAGVKIKVLHMEGAKDPDEFLKKRGSLRFKVLLEKANSVAQSNFSILKSQYDLKTEEDKVQYVNESIALLADIGDPVERDVYVSKVAKESGVLKEIIHEKVNKYKVKSHNKQKQKQWQDLKTGKALYQDRVNPQKAVYMKESRAEEGIIDILMKNPDYEAYILSKISIDDFVTDFNKKVFKFLLQVIRKKGSAAISDLSQLLTVDEMGKLAAILAENELFVHSKKQLDDYMDVLIAHKNSKDANNLKEMTPEEIQELYIDKKKYRKD